MHLCRNIMLIYQKVCVLHLTIQKGKELSNYWPEIRNGHIKPMAIILNQKDGYMQPHIRTVDKERASDICHLSVCPSKDEFT